MKLVFIFPRFPLFLYCMVSSLLLLAAEKEAIVISPVADLLGQAYHRSPNKKISFAEYYNDIPFSGSGVSCLRLHQLLFHERVTVLEEKGEEVKVKVPNFYYVKENESLPTNTFWMLKKHLVFLEDLSKKSIDISKLPPPISYETTPPPLTSSGDRRVITLKKPYKDPVSQMIFSVGTRFIPLENQDFSGNYDEGFFRVYFLDPVKKTLLNMSVPKNFCIRNYSDNRESQTENFIRLLKSWTLQKKGFIPYVLGGSSWTTNCLEDHFEAVGSPQDPDNYVRRSEWAESGKIGFDCVGIIARAAQICEIPFYFKNTTTLLKELEPIGENDTVSNGDLIWFRGHVMVISDTEKNLIIESRGYDNWKGKVQEMPINRIFHNISNVAELKKYSLKKEPLQLLDYRGNPYKACRHIKILKFRSVWKNRSPSPS